MMDRVRLLRGVVLAAFAAGFVAAPAVHLALHERPHRHDGDVAVEHDEHPHRHAHPHPHAHPHAGHHHRGGDRGGRNVPFDPDHGRHSIAHHSAAGGVHVDPFIDAACCELGFLGLASAEESIEVAGAPRATHLVRGPPPV